MNKSGIILTAISILLALVVCFVYYFFGIDERVLLGFLGLIVAFYFGILRLKVEGDKLFKDLFTEFNKRYDIKLNDLLNSLKADTTKELDEVDRNLIIDYFNLCAEEFLWKKKGRIPPDVWKAWKAGIESNLEIPQVREIFEKEAMDKKIRMSYYGLMEELDKKRV